MYGYCMYYVSAFPPSMLHTSRIYIFAYKLCKVLASSTTMHIIIHTS